MRQRRRLVSSCKRLGSLRRARIAIWILALASAPGAADAIVWTTNGPVGGLVQALAVDPSDPAKLYAGTSSGGFFRSSNGGFSWSAIDTGIAPSSFVMTGVAVNPLNPARVYGTGQNAGQGFFFRSVDGGETWSSVPMDATANDIAAGRDPFQPDRIYYAGQALYRTLNGGDNWFGVSFTGPYHCVVVDPTLPTTVYAGASGHIRKSTDYGGTWVSKSNGLPAGRNVQAIAVHPTTPSTLYAGVETSGVYKSTDGGDNWTPVGPAAFSVNGLVIDPANPNTIHAAGIVSGGVGVYTSTNGGSTWSPMPLAQSAWALVHAPLAPARLFAGTSDGIFSSADAGASWSTANTGLANRAIRSLATGTGGRVYAGTTIGKVFRSDDGGASWQANAPALASETITAVAVDPTNPAVVYAGTIGTGGIHKSLDAGATWSPLNTGSPAINGYSLAVDPTNPSIVYAGAFGGVFRSTQGGANWTVNNSVGPFVTALVIDPASPSTLYAGHDPINAAFQGVYKTTNSGGLWTPVNTGLPAVAGTAVQALALDPVTGAVYAGLENLGVYKTTNGGASWSAVNAGVANLDVTSLRVDPGPPSMVYAGTRGGGVFRSGDGGSQWVAIGDGLHNPRVEALAVTAPGRPLAGTAGNGVFFVPACADERDNDGDGAIDFDGGPALGTPDPQCTAPTRNREAPGSCGLGGELAIGLWWIGARRRKRSLATLGAGLFLAALWLGAAPAATAQVFQLLCRVGTFSPTGLSPCTPCPVGTFASGIGSHECQACAPGTYADVEGSAQCVRDEAQWPEPSFIPFFPCEFRNDLERCIKGGIRTGGIVHVIEEEVPGQDVFIEGKSFTLRPLDGVTPVFAGESTITVYGDDGADDVRVEIEGLAFEDGRILASQAGTGRFAVAIRDNVISGTETPGPIEITPLILPPPLGPTEFEITGNRIALAASPTVATSAIRATPTVSDGNTGVIRGNKILQLTGNQASGIEVIVTEASLALDVIGNQIDAFGFARGIHIAQFGDSALSARIANNVVAGQVDSAGVRGAIVAGVIGGAADLAIVNNSVAHNDTGLQVSRNPSPIAEVSGDVANNVIAFNGEGLFLEDGVSNAFNLVFGNDADSFTPGPGTLHADPLFSESLSLTAESPARDAGSNAFVPADLGIDIRGSARIVGASVDIGAYELPEISSALGSATTIGCLYALCSRRRRASQIESASATSAPSPQVGARS